MMWGLIARSESYPAAELDLALALARERGWHTRVVETREIENPEYRANDGRRCYHCKSELFTHLAAIAAGEGYAAVAYGANVDDMSDWRPGHQAARERGVLSPLYEVGMTKGDIRAAARYLLEASKSRATALRWARGVRARIQTLRANPGRCPVDPDSEAYGREVRVLLYGRRRGVYRILFAIEGDVVQVLTVRHAARRSLREQHPGPGGHG